MQTSRLLSTQSQHNDCLLRNIRMTILLFIGVLQGLPVLRCCELIVSGELNIKLESAVWNACYWGTWLGVR